ncbi:MAG: DNA-directed RNA polymerase subunit alpha [Patescibacteria group bacterium]
MLLSTADVKIKKESEKGNVGVFSFDPLPTGFGHTLGNSLRRVLLTSLEGSAITQIKYEKALHQFTGIEGIKEDLVEINLNLKGLHFKMHTDNPVVGRISVTGPGEVTAGDIEISSEVEVLDKKAHIATLADKKAKFEAEIIVEKGVGYLTAEGRESSKLGVILLDAVFSPVLSATYEVVPTRFGSVTGLDKLLFTVETDGSLSPEEAVTQAATQLRNFFSRFSDGEDEEIVEEEVVETTDALPTANEDVSLDELPLPTRTINALKKQDIETLHQLSELSDDDLSDIKNLGDKSITEIKKLLKKEGLRQ